MITESFSVCIVGRPRTATVAGFPWPVLFSFEKAVGIYMAKKLFVLNVYHASHFGTDFVLKCIYVLCACIFGFSLPCKTMFTI